METIQYKGYIIEIEAEENPLNHQAPGLFYLDWNGTGTPQAIQSVAHKTALSYGPLRDNDFNKRF